MKVVPLVVLLSYGQHSLNGRHFGSASSQFEHRGALRCQCAGVAVEGNRASLTPTLRQLASRRADQLSMSMPRLCILVPFSHHSAKFLFKRLVLVPLLSILNPTAPQPRFRMKLPLSSRSQACHARVDSGRDPQHHAYRTVPVRR